jgi:hypothetical protein
MSQVTSHKVICDNNSLKVRVVHYKFSIVKALAYSRFWNWGKKLGNFVCLLNLSTSDRLKKVINRSWSLYLLLLESPSPYMKLRYCQLELVRRNLLISTSLYFMPHLIWCRARCGRITPREFKMLLLPSFKRNMVYKSFLNQILFLEQPYYPFNAVYDISNKAIIIMSCLHETVFCPVLSISD